jgi:hypothetical protein
MDGAGAKRGKEVTEEDDLKYYRAMFRNSLWWSAAIVVMFALFALLA